MTDRPVSDFMLSATLHAVVAGILFAAGYVAQQQVRQIPQILELVAGEGDNFDAKVAPALGIPGGIKFDVTAPPAPEAEPTPILPVEEPTPPAPITPAPIPKAAPPPPKKVEPAPVKEAEPPAPNFAQQIRKKLIRAESKAKADVAKERKAEAKRVADEKKRMTKAEFDKLNKKSAAKGGSPTKVARNDAEGNAKGVVGGSTDNKVGGAGGKALVSDNDDVLAAYFALFKQRLKNAFEAPDGMSDTLEVTVRVTSNADGRLTNPRVVKSSGSAEFDRAVLAAIGRVTMPARPDGRSEPIDIPFSMRETEGR
jgi:colicin import membrane protein